MRIYDHIRNNTIDSKRQIFLSKSHTTSSFLPMPTSKLIPNLRISNASDPNFGKLITSGIFGDNNQINNPLLGPSGPKGRILILAFSLNSRSIGITRNKNLSNKYFLILNSLSRWYNAIGIKFINSLIINFAFFTIRFTYFC